MSALAALLLAASAAWGADAAREGAAYVAPKDPVRVVQPQEQEPYAAFLAQAWLKAADSGPLARQTLLLENDAMDAFQPRRRAWERHLIGRVRGQGRAAEDALRAYLGRPQQVVRFYTFPPIGVPVRLVRSDLLRSVLDQGGWEAFWRAYPKTQGILSFSAPAFSAAGDECVFSARLQCGRFCGYRDWVLMRKVNGAWTLIMKDGMP